MGVNVARVRVWDAPVRAVHWSIVVLMAIAWLTRDARYVDLHAAAGYGILGLAAFRIAWGFVGTRHARFRDFAYSAGDALGYLRELATGRVTHYHGHNPAGSWSVYALILLELAVSITGVLAIAGMHNLGPAAGALGHEAADVSLGWHEWMAWALLALVVVHLLGVAASSIAHRENLVAAMMGGFKQQRANADESVAGHGGVAVALVAFVGVGCGMYLMAASRLAASGQPGAGAVQIAAAWQKECDSCHLPYATCMLPEASWQRMLDEQSDHFGEDLALREPVLAELRSVAKRATPGEPWACWKTRQSLPAGAAPIDITGTPYWKESHASLEPASLKTTHISGPHDCGACHRDAASSIFHPRMIQIPQ